MEKWDETRNRFLATKEHLERYERASGNHVPNYVLSHVDTMAAYDEKTFAILDLNFRFLLCVDVDIPIYGCGISDDGTRAAFMTLPGREETANMLTFVDVQNQSLLWNVLLPFRSVQVQGIHIAMDAERIYLHCGTTDYIWDFEGNFIDENE